MLTFHRACAVVACVLSVFSGGAWAADEKSQTSTSEAEPSARNITPSITYTDVYGREDLMEGGQLVVDPLDDSIRYYVSSDWAAWKPENRGKPIGLLVSFDRGETWRVLSRAFEFLSLFVHPEDGRLYAIIQYEWQQDDDEGFLRRHHANKVVVSEDGKRWRDITRGPGYVATLSEVFQDPDHPDRVCVRGNILRSYVMQYTDDQYSDWVMIRAWDWEAAHPDGGKKEFRFGE